MNLFFNIGQYFLMMKKVFSRPEKTRIYVQQTIKEFEIIGINSVGIVALISAFMGAILAIQTAYNMENPLLPNYLVGLAVRDSVLLEFSSSIICLILSGKVGSNIASEIGTMRVTEQIDALEIMGINSASYLVLPKLVAAFLTFPLLVIMSMFIAIMGGWLGGLTSGMVPTEEFIYGVQYAFHPFYIVYALIKTAAFSFIIISISSYQGYYTSGGALEVGKASTKAVVYSSVMVLLFNLLLTQLILT